MAKPDQSATMADINRTPPETDTSDHDSRESRGEGSTTSGGGKSMLDTAKERVAEEAQNARDAASETAREKADRLREAGEAFEEDSFARHAADQFAEQLGAAARTVRDADLAHVADDVTDFARRQPLVFFGGAAVLGFLAARMLKASERSDGGHGTEDSGPADYGTHYGSDPWETV
ncbi:hypothetical protein P6F26_05075 [Roseibacterium sp. SDUM158017]|uniref:hypothetical protein n=1 Tax=Roseicyclus salinarum TaxID=3036773 RepID=UPI0024158340|nr:hypothetical protein [Roseibacterium sp. SDUM158017]MDG4647806.1 hypothetical protein [Roseibacterium sp. SDUM158017]